MIKMIDVAIIPARGGSKRLPNKNLRFVGGKPLIAWTVEAALYSNCFNRVVVSTDDESIAKAARDAGAEVPFMRPREIASDTATAMDVALHAIDQLGTPDLFGFLQPTSPLRTAAHIKEATSKFFTLGSDALISVSNGKPSSWLFEIGSKGELSKLLNGDIATHSQHAEMVCSPNGAIYLYRTEKFLNYRSFIPPKTTAYEMSHIDSIDIDDLSDFQLVECIVNYRLGFAQTS